MNNSTLYKGKLKASLVLLSGLLAALFSPLSAAQAQAVTLSDIIQPTGAVVPFDASITVTDTNPVLVPQQPLAPAVPIDVPLPTNLQAALLLPSTISAHTNTAFTLRFSNLAGDDTALSASRDSLQDCAYAPLLKITTVDTHTVVYPTATTPKICTQDVLDTTLSAGQSLSFNHNLSLPAGEYVVEAWFKGQVNGVLQQINAEPVRLSVH